jgi:hypothetical protein
MVSDSTLAPSAAGTLDGRTWQDRTGDMRMRGGRWPALAVAVVLLEVLVACGGPGAGGATGGGGEPGGGGGTLSETASSAPARLDFDAETELADGRRVGVAYAAGSGLLEQHRDAATGAWSAPSVVYRTASQPCQSLTLKAFDETVAVIADWGYYCADGEPPTESIAAVGTADLSRWDTKTTKDFDGWTKVTPHDDTRRLTFTRDSTEWLTRLEWSRAEGFAEVEEIRRDTT